MQKINTYLEQLAEVRMQPETLQQALDILLTGSPDVETLVAQCLFHPRNLAADIFAAALFQLKQEREFTG